MQASRRPFRLRVGRSAVAIALGARCEGGGSSQGGYKAGAPFALGFPPRSKLSSGLLALGYLPRITTDSDRTTEPSSSTKLRETIQDGF